MKTIALWGCGLLSIVGLGCSDRHAGQPIDETKSALIGGTNLTTVNPPDNPGTVAVYVNGGLQCSGTLIRRQWVLTAKQCVVNGQGQLVTPGTVSVVRELTPGVTEPPSANDIDLIIAHETRNLAVLRVGFVQWEDSPMVNPAALSDRALPTNNTMLKNQGYGCQFGGNGAGACTNSGRLRSADLPVSSTDLFAGTINQSNVSASLTDRDWGGPAYTMFDASTRFLPGVAAVNASRVGTTSTSVAVDSNRRWIMQSAFTAGNMRGGAIRQADIALVGATNSTTIRSVHVDTDPNAPSFFVTSEAAATGFTDWAKPQQVEALSGDFNGDRRADMLLLGGPGWNTSPIAWAPSLGDSVSNRVNPDVASITQEIDAKVATGDFDGDGWSDIVVMRGASTLVNLFMASADGFVGPEFYPTQWDLGASFGSDLMGGRLLTGDFNGDGLDDLAVVGNSTSEISTALSNGSFTPTFLNRKYSFPVGAWANYPNASTLVGDWDGDGRDDIAVFGGNGSNEIRVARSLANGVFDQLTFSSPDITNFTGWARTRGVQAVSGDYNGDGRDDIALVGGWGWNTVPIAFSQPPTFFVTNNQTTFAAWAQETGSLKVVSAHQAQRQPPASMAVEPMENGNFVYQVNAPKKQDGSTEQVTMGRINLDLTFQNTGVQDATLDKVRVSFIGGPSVAPVEYTPALTIAPGTTQQFRLLYNEVILIPQPAPNFVVIDAEFSGFNRPNRLIAPLVPHVSPVTGGAWSWPGNATDIPPGHAFQAIGRHTPWAGEGFGLDIDVRRFDQASGQWSWLRPGTTENQNANHLIFGVPVRAMADGTVVNAYDGFPTNPAPPGQWCDAANPLPPGVPCPPYYGNAFFIQSGPEMVLYAHLQAGTLPAALMTPNTFVPKGTILGLAGNSGNSSKPHLHIYTSKTTVQAGGPLRPMPFRELWMLDDALAKPPSFSAPWNFVDGNGVPDVSTLIFPSLTRPPWVATGVVASQSSDLGGGVASRASDGNIDGNWDHHSVTHTALQTSPWWRGDLGTVRFVAGIDVYNRTDCCADRLSNFNVAISQNGFSWTMVANIPGQAGSPTSIPINMNARYVRIRLLGTNYLSLAEVNIWVR
jgi:hypothetical protein